MNAAPQIILSALLMVLCACVYSQPPVARPALAANLDEAGIAELTRVIGATLSNPNVTLGDDPFVNDSVLLIERARIKDSNGALLNGRVLQKPERFQLLIVGGECVLFHEATSQRWPLKQLQCKAVARVR